MSQAGSSIASTHACFHAFLLSDIPVDQLHPRPLGADFIPRGSRVKLIKFLLTNADEKVRFYSNEFKAYGFCDPEDIQDFDKSVKAWVTMRDTEALPYEEDIGAERAA